MRILKTVQEVRDAVAEQRRMERTVGFVPTMGALHDGHLSLIERSVEENDFTIASIYVNPTQFGPGEDFDAYPRRLEGDAALAEEAGADAVYAPDTESIYGEHPVASVFVAELSQGLCGMSRGSSHFRGVCTVVTKLFNIVQPDRAYFGQKDIQQFLILDRMVHELHLPIEVIPCPIVREADGLAMSSRNQYLSESDRARATVLYRALCTGRAMLREGEVHSMVLQEAMAEVVLAEENVELDYLDIVDPQALKDVGFIDDTVILAGAVKIGETRLIDNLIVHPQHGPWSEE